MEKILPADNPYYNIPSLVTYIILRYYFHGEKFTLHDDHIELNEKGTIATHTGGLTYDIVYGERLVQFNSGLVYEWRIKILDQGDGRENIGIGILAEESCKKKEQDSSFTYFNRFDIKDENLAVVYWCCGDLDCSTDCDQDRYGKREFNMGDIVKLIVDTKLKTVAFYVNDEQEIMIKIENDKQLDCTKIFRLAIDLWNQASIELV